MEVKGGRRQSFWEADGTGYGWLAEEDRNRRKTEEKRRKRKRKERGISDKREGEKEKKKLTGEDFVDRGTFEV